MKIFKLSSEEQGFIVREVAKTLTSGGVALLPTETVYGLFCVASDDAAFSRIYEIKGRPVEKALALTLSSPEEIKKYTLIQDWQQKVLNEILPGPVTIVLLAQGCSLLNAVSQENTIGVRIPDYELVLRIIKAAGVPLLSTSANKSGMPAVSRFQDIDPTIIKLVDVSVDAGDCPLKEASTVVDMSQLPVKIIRKGAYPEDRINEIVSKAIVKPEG